MASVLPQRSGGLVQTVEGPNVTRADLNQKVESNIYQPIVQDAGPAGGGGGGGAGGAGAIEMDLLRVGSEPVGMRCPHCQEDVMTKAVYRTTMRTHIVAAILAVFFWWLCCCVLPYLMRMCKNVEHYCPHCRQYLGVYTRSHIV